LVQLGCEDIFKNHSLYWTDKKLLLTIRDNTLPTEKKNFFINPFTIRGNVHSIRTSIFLY